MYRENEPLIIKRQNSKKNQTIDPKKAGIYSYYDVFQQLKFILKGRENFNQVKAAFYESSQENVDNMFKYINKVSQNQFMNLQILPTARDYCDFLEIHMNEAQYEDTQYLSLK